VRPGTKNDQADPVTGTPGDELAGGAAHDIEADIGARDGAPHAPGKIQRQEQAAPTGGDRNRLADPLRPASRGHQRRESGERKGMAQARSHAVRCRLPGARLAQERHAKRRGQGRRGGREARYEPRQNDRNSGEWPGEFQHPRVLDRRAEPAAHRAQQRRDVHRCSG
jgi:hypothetical protein